MHSSLKHHFLLAMPGLAGDFFGGSILYVCEHNENGAMGLVVNRPGSLCLADVLTELEISHADAPATRLETPVLVGGPVQPEHGFVLHDDAAESTSLDLGQGLLLGSARSLLEALAANQGPAHWLLALGYTGWGAGQLEQELVSNAWLACPADPDQARRILFATPFERRVQAAADLLGIDFSLMAPQAGHA